MASDAITRHCPECANPLADYEQGPFECMWCLHGFAMPEVRLRVPDGLDPAFALKTLERLAGMHRDLKAGGSPFDFA